MKMLTHYTNSIKGTVNILKNGFAWVANRRELTNTLFPPHDYSKREPQQFGMVSFTETQPGKVQKEINAFGRYGITVSNDWAIQQNVQRVTYVENEGPVTDSLRSIFKIGYHDCKARIKYPDDAAWQMAFENKAAAGAIAGAALWANLLQLYEYMESAQFASEREWRIVHPAPNYNLANKPLSKVIKDVSPPQGWGNYLSVVKVKPEDIEAIICPSSGVEKMKKELPAIFSTVRIIKTEA